MKYRGVLTTLRNDGTVPGRLRDQLDLRDVPEKDFFGAFRFRDGSAIQNLGPGLTEQLVFAWQVTDAVAQSLAWVTIRVWKKIYTQLKVTAARSGSTPTTTGRSSCPCRGRREATHARRATGAGRCRG